MESLDLPISGIDGIKVELRRVWGISPSQGFVIFFNKVTGDFAAQYVPDSGFYAHAQDFLTLSGQAIATGEIVHDEESEAYTEYYDLGDWVPVRHKDFAFERRQAIAEAYNAIPSGLYQIGIGYGNPIIARNGKFIVQGNWESPDRVPAWAWL